MNWVVVPGDATCPTLFEGMDRLLPTEGVEGTDDTLAPGKGAGTQGGGAPADSSRAPWCGRVARASGVAEEDEDFAARADIRELLAFWA